MHLFKIQRLLPTNQLWWAKGLFLILVLVVMVQLTTWLETRISRKRAERISIIDAKIADIVRNKVQPTFSGLGGARTNILILHYHPVCPLCKLTTEIPNSFQVDLYQKFLDLRNTALLPTLLQTNAVTLASAVNLIRSVYTCPNSTSSKLLSQEEMKKCSESQVKIVLSRFFSLSEFEPIIHEFKSSIMVYIIPSDPRHQMKTIQLNMDKAQKLQHFKMLCHKMTQDLDLSEEQGVFLPLAFSTIYHEVFLIRPWRIWQKINRLEEKYKFNLLPEYSWLSENPGNTTSDYRLVDNVCKDFYSKSIYRNIDDKTRFYRLQGALLPLKTGGEIFHG
ncbi:uncharacterized protein LOC111709344 isoform X2 [Eurytemora carolleeae]|uniref:uncharacterized protein LOC111709344 isoform X2 n=1 Tax=Eurytemora carolleeae TaxID=1294199 RepID=UPI000C77CE86|nr:uncharacterized protein LOC111709344 isoform X2 [Eurytemora carolleeae]|eukprot:XP_023338756.1 uncharacterized protein LOC111709344 isoform X2 [Eurytemora affinis]